jgi:hypothetical protein
MAAKVICDTNHSQAPVALWRLYWVVTTVAGIEIMTSPDSGTFKSDGIFLFL